MKNEKLYYFKKPNLYCITAENFSLGRKNIEVVEIMLDAGVKIIQYREKKKSLREKYKEALALRDLTLKYKAVLIINDHLDLCKMVEGDGVHLGQDDYPLSSAREFLGENYIIGITVHNKEQVIKAYEEGADYIGLGPIFESYTKENPHPPIGLEILKWATSHINIPIVAIGGINEHNLPLVLKNGGKCIAMVREIVSSENIKEKIEKIFKILEEYEHGKNNS
ncbi:MAG: thiamine phosphate synthase [Dictyoglomus sp.]|nr:thiamine phosphate synthase [Dictyoglomus sp.]MCX7942093.1 thiamine phosphate synthase [Dictyoglomaceae bacterium]MDW8187940.1 thiamine phosphate synthase [Dictyoglomus sp.]